MTSTPLVKASYVPHKPPKKTKKEGKTKQHPQTAFAMFLQNRLNTLVSNEAIDPQAQVSSDDLADVRSQRDWPAPVRGFSQEVPEYSFVYGSNLRKCRFSVDFELATQLTRQPPQSPSKRNLVVRARFGGAPSTVEEVVRVWFCCLLS